MTRQKENKTEENNTAEWNSVNMKVEGGIIQMKKASKVGRKKEISKGDNVNAINVEPIILHANIKINRTSKNINKQYKIIYNNF